MSDLSEQIEKVDRFYAAELKKIDEFYGVQVEKLLEKIQIMQAEMNMLSSRVGALERSR